jgi:hypothetical protein
MILDIFEIFHGIEGWLFRQVAGKVNDGYSFIYNLCLICQSASD